MRAVRREEFLPSNLREFAYEDSPLPIASGQTISQPYVVAFMIEALLLKGGEDVLEIGTGSGHAAAIVCTENPIRIDWRRESPNVSAPNSTQSTVRPKITVTKSQYEVAFFL
jgi:tRNA A58 N-methylase Trm61